MVPTTPDTKPLKCDAHRRINKSTWRRVAQFGWHTAHVLMCERDVQNETGAQTYIRPETVAAVNSKYSHCKHEIYQNSNPALME